MTDKSIVIELRPNATFDPALSVHSVGTSRMVQPLRLSK